MNNADTHIPEALRDVFAKLTSKNRSEITTLQQLSEEDIRAVSSAGWGGNVHRYSFG